MHLDQTTTQTARHLPMPAEPMSELGASPLHRGEPVRLRVLLVEDSEDDAVLVLRELSRRGYEPIWMRVETPEALTQALTLQQWDLVLCDYVMPQLSGPIALQMLRALDPDVPAIVVSGESREEVPVSAMQAGADDYVAKGRLARLVPAIERELREVDGRRQRRSAERVRRECELSSRASMEKELAELRGQVATLRSDKTRLVEEVATATRLRSELVANMSHELRTPLNIILGYGELLLDGAFGPMPDAQLEALRRVDRSARELQELISATLDFGRLETERMPVYASDIVLQEIMAEISAELRPPVDQPGVPLTWQVSEDLPTVRTDGGKLKVILKNVIVNALKFTPQGGVTVDVHASAHGIEITVSDTGIGIAAEMLPTIFEPFRQGDGSMTRAHGGLGLGLYLVRRLLDMLAGTIEVSSTVGRGSTFRINVPSLPR